MKQYTKIIINPIAGAKSTLHKWPGIQSLLKHLGVAFDFQFTEGRGHGIELAKTAAAEGYSTLVAVGGDGTIHEVANGILQTDAKAEASLGIICTGTGSDLCRTLGVSHDIAQSCSNLTGGRRRVIDIGLVKYYKKGQPEQRYFVNGAGIGFDATVVAAVDSLPKYINGTLPYVTGLLRTFLTYRNCEVTLKIGDRSVEKVKVLSLVVANGRYFGGGMQIAPQARVDDAQFDIVVLGNFGKIELIRNLSKVYKGTHLALSKVRLEKDIYVTLESKKKLLVQADGELLGEGPVSFTLLPSALTLTV
jgi:YegS/Rv2252/BmrU family lipid kinase